MRAPRITEWLKANFKDHHFLLLWTAVGLFQIAVTELTSDEGYYWLFSTRMEWGYYEHPPFLALMIRAGTTFFNGEFGVRVADVILLSVGLGFFLRTLSARQKPFAYVILLGLPLLNYLSFLAFPDTPLLGLAGITLYVYRRYLDRDDLRTALLLAVLVACMFYAKYHTILFVGGVLLSNLSLLRRKNVWIAAAVSAALYVPHLWWQHTHGYPSFNFHLKDRSSGIFYFDNLIDYVWQQWLVIGVGLIWVPFVCKTKDQYERSLRFVAIVTLLFFLVNSLRGYVHMHWTAIALLPIVHLSASYYASRKTWTRFALLVWPNILFVIGLRLVLAFPIAPSNHWNADYYHGRPLWAEDIHAIAGADPVVFETGYRALREAPLYEFYAGGPSMALYPHLRKKSQYQIWNYEDRMQGRRVVLITDPRQGSRPLETRMGRVEHYRVIEDFVSYDNIAVRPDGGDGTRTITLRIANHRESPLAFRPDDRLFLELQDDEEESVTITRPLAGVTVEAGGHARFEIALEPGEVAAGTYRALVHLSNPYTLRSANSKPWTATIGPPRPPGAPR